MNLDIEGAGKALSPAGYILDTAFVKTQKPIQPCGIAVSTATSCPSLRIPDLSRKRWISASALLCLACTISSSILP